MSDKGWYQLGDFACSCEIPYVGAQTTLPTRCERCGGIITGQIAAEPSPLPPSEKAERQRQLVEHVDQSGHIPPAERGKFFVSNETPLSTSPERAELQVSLLNALGSQLAEQAETLKTYKLSLEGIQGLLVELDAKLDRPLQVEASDEHMSLMKRALDQGDVMNIRLGTIEGVLMAQAKGLGVINHKVLMIDLALKSKPRKAGKRPAPKAKVTHKTR